MWILFLIPRIEDGNNFGVSIQEDTLTEVRTVETEAATYFDQVSPLSALLRHPLSRLRRSLTHSRTCIRERTACARSSFSVRDRNSFPSTFM